MLFTLTKLTALCLIRTLLMTLPLVTMQVNSASRQHQPVKIPAITTAKIAIVIDDIGYQTSDQKMLNIDAPLSYAVLPHTPLGYRYALQATKNNRDVLIHLPMQADHNNHLLGLGALTSQMDKQEYQRTLLSAMEDIPFAIGINNHMGSLLTRMEQPMQWTMELLRQHNMFFLDSKTTRHSKVEQLAKQHGVMSLNRNIFLDHSRDKRHMEQQFQRLINIAKNYGTAVGIGHPYQETYQLLRQKLPQLQQAGIEVVPISALLQHRLSLAKQNNTATKTRELDKDKASD